MIKETCSTPRIREDRRTAAARRANSTFAEKELQTCMGGIIRRAQSSSDDDSGQTTESPPTDAAVSIL